MNKVQVGRAGAGQEMGSPESLQETGLWMLLLEAGTAWVQARWSCLSLPLQAQTVPCLFCVNNSELFKI